MPGRKPPSVALSALPSNWVEDWLSLVLWPPLHRHLLVRLHWSMPPILSRSVTHPPHLPYQKLWMWSASPPVHRLKPPRANATHLSNEVLWLQGEMNVALEQLFTTKATLNSCQRELVQNAKIATCWNEAQTTRAIKEAEVRCAAEIREAETHYEVVVQQAEAHSATKAQALKQSHEESVFKLECEALAEEGCNCWAFVEVCGTALQVCTLKAHGVLISPLQLLARGVP